MTVLVSKDVELFTRPRGSMQQPMLVHGRSTDDEPKVMLLPDDAKGKINEQLTAGSGAWQAVTEGIDQQSLMSFESVIEAIGEMPMKAVPEWSTTNSILLQLPAALPSVTSIRLQIPEGATLVTSDVVSSATDTQLGSMAKQAAQPAGIRSESATDLGAILVRLNERLNSNAVLIKNGDEFATPLSPVRAEKVSLEQIKRASGYAGTVTIEESRKSSFQAAVPIVFRISAEWNSTSRSMGTTRQLADADTIPATTVGSSIPDFDNRTALGSQASDPGTDQGFSRSPTRHGGLGEKPFPPLSAATAPAASEPAATNVTIAPPYQQVRAAVAEAIISGDRAGATDYDYASAFANVSDRQRPKLSTLELVLQPQDLGRVTVKMTLSAKDLTLDIAASQLTTAQLIADDAVQLRRELMGEAGDLKSVLVTVSTALGDAKSGSPSGSDQQMHGGAKSHNHDQSQSDFLAGRGQDRRQPQRSDSNNEVLVAGRPRNLDQGQEPVQSTRDARYI